MARADSEPEEFDSLVHAPVRLAVLALLVGAEEADFTFLRERTGTSDGNLSVHLAKLEHAGYLAVRKRFVDRKPRSTYRLTERGRAAFTRHVARLKALLKL